MNNVYTENKYFIFTFSHIPQIIDLFESTELYYAEDNTTACGSSFATEKEALEFAYKIECLKRECFETQYIVKRSLNPFYIHNLFTHDMVTPINYAGALIGLLN